MDFHKDYYGILGCTADADQAVIQAAYRALAKKYHPDANQGSNESKEKFQEIQEAYETLSDPTKRAYYDAMRSGASGHESAPGEAPPDDTSTENAEQKKRWETIREYFPEIDKISNKLGEISANLKQIFQIIMIESKNFKQAEIIANDIEDIYLTRYFGEDKAIKTFAKKLLRHKNLYLHADALRDLNKTIAILGAEAPSDKIIQNLTQKYDLHWISRGDNPYSSTAQNPLTQLPDKPAAWLAIRRLAPHYGWKEEPDFFGNSFRHEQSETKIRCFTPERARKLMKIPLEEALKQLRKKGSS
jgi:curved DNA-binding protein CbpA